MTILGELGGKTVTRIGEKAFEGKNITSIKIPKPVTEIGSDAFWDAKSLSTVEFEAGSKLQTIGEDAFAYTGLTSKRIPSSVVNMGPNIFNPKTTEFTIMSLLDNIAHEYALKKKITINIFRSIN